MKAASTDSILVLDADGRVGVACVQSLGPAGNIMHVGVRKLGALIERSHWVSQIHAQPPAEPVEAGVAWLVDIDARLKFRLILATTEASLRWLRALPEDHPVRLKAILPSNEALDSALDKDKTSAIARGLGLPVPATHEIPQGDPTHLLSHPAVPDAAERVWPLVLKPVRSKVVMGTRLMTLAVAIVHDEDARAATLANWLPHTAVQEQRWVPGRGVGVEMLYDHGRLAWHFVHERLHEWPLTGGASTLRRAGNVEPELVAMTRRLLDHLKWHGVAMVEWRRAEDGTTHLMEINPRLWGSLPLTIAAGVDIPRGLLALARGETLSPAKPWRIGLTARNFTDDLQWFIDNARADRKDPLLLTEAPWRTAWGWIRGLTGQEVWDGWSRRDTGIARGEIAALVRHRLGSLAQRVERRATISRARQHHATIGRADGPLAKPIRSVLFICLGNLCRSPFAAIAASERLPHVSIESAGFLHHEGRKSPPHVVTTAKALGVDLSQSRARRITAEHIAAADLIVCMDVTHLELMGREFPGALAKTTLLGLFNGKGPAEIKDPYDMTAQGTRQVFKQMLASLDALADANAAHRVAQDPLQNSAH